LISNEIIINPIGVVRSELKHRYETPRQGVLAGKVISVIKLNPKNNFQQALKYLDGFERIWVLYQFHLNNNWKPLISPPRHTRKKVGVFASRAPYRPNQIGMSCVKLEKVEGLNIYISESDMLDGSPVFDIKPYLPYSDSFPDAATGWVKKDYDNKYKVEFDPKAEKQCNWLKENANINLVNFSRLQLEFSPGDATRKRVSMNTADNSLTLAYRTWRIRYRVNDFEKKVFINEINSGYSKEELKMLNDDKYNDKPLHISFTKKFKI
jgi:tRNA-Thr(GGU) m(6)t(6)A37 methyltransferase TsaA